MGFSKKIFIYSFIVFSCFLLGTIFFLVQRDLLIFKVNLKFWDNGGDLIKTSHDSYLRKKVKLYFFKDEKFLNEEEFFVLLADKSENLKHLINNWLAFLQQERLLDKKVYVENVLIDQGGQLAYISFDQSPFNYEWSIFQKCNFVECLFKTIKSLGIELKKVSFLVSNQVLDDDHLDFSESWPIDGFLQEFKIF
jgi:hypothetical protein